MPTIAVLVIVIIFALAAFWVGELISRRAIRLLQTRPRVRSNDLEEHRQVELRASIMLRRATHVHQMMQNIEQDLLIRG